MVRPIFHDRIDAGRRLARELHKHAGRNDLLVLGLPRGGVPVAYEVARALNAPLDIFIVRKLGVPGHEELAMGALASGGLMVLNREVIRQLPDADRLIEEARAREQRELERRERDYRGDRPRPPVKGRAIILVDDGLATGASMRAAVRALRQEDPGQLIVAVPLAAQETRDSFRGEADEIVCLAMPEPFYAVGLWYEDFAETTDAEVRELLAGADVGSGSTV